MLEYELAPVGPLDRRFLPNLVESLGVSRWPNGPMTPPSSKDAPIFPEESRLTFPYSYGLIFVRKN